MPNNPKIKFAAQSRVAARIVWLQTTGHPLLEDRVMFYFFLCINLIRNLIKLQSLDFLPYDADHFNKKVACKPIKTIDKTEG